MWVVRFVAQGRGRYRSILFTKTETTDQKSRCEITSREEPRRKS